MTGVSTNHGAMRVIKLGGSLLDWPQWPEALRRWRQVQPPMCDVLIVGGGAWADLIRDADARFSLGGEASHWLCLQLMSVTARLAHTLLPEAEWLDSSADCQHPRQSQGLNIVDCLPLIEQTEHENDGPTLPHSWAVTSDSIAAWLAARLHAAELVLLKSQLPPQDSTRASASGCGYVDPYFPTAVAAVPLVRCVDLRTAGMPGLLLRH